MSRLHFSGPEYMVATNNPVFACEQATFINYECVHALCKVCYKDVTEKQNASEDQRGTTRKNRCIYTAQIATTIAAV